MYGVSFPITVVLLDYWLKDCNVPITTIGLFSLFHFPFMLKFLWAPIIDNYHLPYFFKKFGQRKSWGMLSQFILIFGIIGLSQCDPSTNLYKVIIFSSIVALADGCMNIALYPHQIHEANSENLGYIAGLVNFGHRTGMIISKVSALYIAHFYNWELAYLFLAFLIFLCSIILFYMEEPPYIPPKNYTYFRDFQEFFKNHQQAALIIFTLIFYRAIDYLTQKMIRAFCLEIGFSKTELADIVQFFGSILAVVGGFFGGYTIKKFHNIYSAMLIVGIAHMFSIFLYFILANVGYDINILWSITFFESITRGCITAMFLAFLYSFCHSGSLYAFTWAIHEMGGIFFSAISGILATNLGWPVFFAIAPLISIPSLIILWNMSQQFKN